MTAEVLAWFYDKLTNADGNPSEQLGRSLRGRRFFFKICFCIHVVMVVADPTGL